MLGMFNNFLRKPQNDVVVKTEDIAYATSALTYGTYFNTYNPDLLLSRKGFDVYKKMMHDEQVKAVVRFHRDAVTGREWGFEDHPRLSDAENAKRKEILNSIICKIPGSFKTRLDMVMSALYTGFSLVEKTYDLVEIDGQQWYGIKSLRLKPFDTFYFIKDEFGNLERLEQQVLGRTENLDLSKFIHYVVNSDIDEHYGQSELREAYRAWWSKDTTLMLQNIYLERVAGGFVWVKPEAGKTMTSTSPEYNSLKTILSTLRSNSAMIFPSGVEVNVEHPADTQAFDRAVMYQDKAIAKALLMPNLLGLSEQGPNGSRALGDTQLEAFLWMLDAEAKGLEECINEQLFQDLADYNFSDGLYPRWVIHKLSNAQKMEIIDKWVSLTGAKAVSRHDSDESHIRTALGFPDLEVDNEDEARTVDPQSALTGVQVNSILEVVGKVAAEQIPRETGVAILVNSYPLTPAQAEEIMSSVGKGFKPKEQPMPGQEGGGPSESPAKPASPTPGTEGDLSTEGDPSEGDPDETLAGKAAARIAAQLSRAEKRVDFKVIANKSQVIESSHVEALSEALTNTSKFITDTLVESDSYTAKDAQDLKFNGRDVQKVRNRARNMLTEAWALGSRHAKDEINKAKGENFTADMERLDENAAEFFNAKSFAMAGRLTSDMLEIMRSEMLRGIKESLSTRDVVDNIYEAFSAEGFIMPEHAEEQMRRILQSREAATARLNTAVRTNTFEAINEARYSYFTDPQLGDFVEALEYSAILDSRTTQICQHLDGQVHSAKGEVWNGPWRPPNHFNCRSLLIPVTQLDAWTEDNLPSMQPQKGFGG